MLELIIDLRKTNILCRTKMKVTGGAVESGLWVLWLSLRRHS